MVAARVWLLVTFLALHPLLSNQLAPPDTPTGPKTTVPNPSTVIKQPDPKHPTGEPTVPVPGPTVPPVGGPTVPPAGEPTVPPAGEPTVPQVPVIDKRAPGAKPPAVEVCKAACGTEGNHTTKTCKKICDLEDKLEKPGKVERFKCHTMDKTKDKYGKIEIGKVGDPETIYFDQDDGMRVDVCFINATDFGSKRIFKKELDALRDSPLVCTTREEAGEFVLDKYEFRCVRNSSVNANGLCNKRNITEIRDACTRKLIDAGKMKEAEEVTNVVTTTPAAPTEPTTTLPPPPPARGNEDYFAANQEPVDIDDDDDEEDDDDSDDRKRREVENHKKLHGDHEHDGNNNTDHKKPEASAVGWSQLSIAVAALSVAARIL